VSPGKPKTVFREFAKPDRYGVCLLLIILTIITSALAGAKWGRVVALGVEGITLLFVLSTSRVRKTVFLPVALFLVIAWLGAVAVLLLDGGQRSAWTISAVALLIALIAPPAILARLRTHPKIDSATVFGALCLYLLLGLVYSSVFSMIGLLEHAPFFVQETKAAPVDYTYFSFVTLTTVGYGDLTAQASLGRMLAISEALVGQLYLVSVVALLISNIGHERRSRANNE
jgi:hypothetical protein